MSHIFIPNWWNCWFHVTQIKILNTRSNLAKKNRAFAVLNAEHRFRHSCSRQYSLGTGRIQNFLHGYCWNIGCFWMPWYAAPNPQRGAHQPSPIEKFNCAVSPHKNVFLENIASVPWIGLKIWFQKWQLTLAIKWFAFISFGNMYRNGCAWLSLIFFIEFRWHLHRLTHILKGVALWRPPATQEQRNGRTLSRWGWWTSIFTYFGRKLYM